MKTKQKSNPKLIFLGIALLIIGIVLIAYPFWKEYLYRESISKQKNNFVEKLAQTEETSIYDTLYNNLKIKNEELYLSNQQNLTDPFAYETNSIDLSEYGIENNIIGYISIPKINVELAIYLGANSQNLASGAAHLTETSYPTGGINTNCVIAAHRGYDTMFRYVDKLENGDEITIQNFKEKLTYKVTGYKIIEVDEIQELFIQDGKDMITLITCHPYGINNQRYLVFAERKI